MRSFTEMIKTPTVRVLCWDNYFFRIVKNIEKPKENQCFSNFSNRLKHEKTKFSFGFAIIFITENMRKIEKYWFSIGFAMI